MVVGWSLSSVSFFVASLYSPRLDLSSTSSSRLCLFSIFLRVFTCAKFAQLRSIDPRKIPSEAKLHPTLCYRMQRQQMIGCKSTRVAQRSVSAALTEKWRVRVTRKFQMLQQSKINAKMRWSVLQSVTIGSEKRGRSSSHKTNHLVEQDGTTEPTQPPPKRRW